MDIYRVVLDGEPIGTLHKRRRQNKTTWEAYPRPDWGPLVNIPAVSGETQGAAAAKLAAYFTDPAP